MKICAVILNYRGARMTELCLSSMIGQGLHKVMVVDNSADDTASAELNMATERVHATGIDYNLCTLRPVTNLGFAGGVNFALANENTSDCDAFLLLNNDAIANPGMVLELSKKLVDHNADLVAPLIVNGDGKVQPVFWYQRFSGLLTHRRIAGAFPYLSGCCLLFRRDLLQANNKLFDEDFFMYGEDTLLGWQLAKSGKVILEHKDVCIHHAGRGSSKKCRLFYEYHMARAHVLLSFKTLRSPIELPLLITTKSIVLALRAVWRSVRFGSAIPLFAFLLAWLRLDIRAT